MEPGLKLNTAQIMQILPHRYPFLLIDRVEAILAGAGPKNIGKKIIATKAITINEPFFQGHFPGNPIVPGVLLLESIAQAAAICAYDPKLHGEPLNVLLLGINKVKFRKAVVPGDMLRIESEIIKDKTNFCTAAGKIFVDDKIVVEAELFAALGFVK